VEADTADPLADQKPATHTHCASDVAPMAEVEPGGHAAGEAPLRQ
jgi:hypothetical protein